MITLPIGRRRFTVGAWYAPRKGRAAPARLFLGVREVSWAREPVVVYRTCPDGRDEGIALRSWAGWAGEEVQP